MKLILVSDLHLPVPGVTLFGSDPLRQMENCIAGINARHADADVVIFSGDLANDGEPPAYAAMAERLSNLAPPYRLMVGNHDDRDALVRAIPNVATEGGFIQSSLDVGTTRLLMLDTLWPGNVTGQLCGKRLAWLDERLAGARDVLVFMHHPPFPIAIPSLDDSRLAEADRLLAILKKHGNVRHIFAGHVHRLSHGSWHGIPFTTVRSTNHQSALNWTGPHAVSHEAPTYGVILLGPAGLIVHMEEFGAGS